MSCPVSTAKDGGAKPCSNAFNKPNAAGRAHHAFIWHTSFAHQKEKKSIRRLNVSWVMIHVAPTLAVLIECNGNWLNAEMSHVAILHLLNFDHLDRLDTGIAVDKWEFESSAFHLTLRTVLNWPTHIVNCGVHISQPFANRPRNMIQKCRGNPWASAALFLCHALRALCRADSHTHALTNRAAKFHHISFLIHIAQNVSWARLNCTAKGSHLASWVN